MGRLLLVAGISLAILGLIFILAPKFPWIGNLPGDICIRKKSFTFYFPLVTSILISIVLSLILWLIGRK